jgi:hypothetical protein
VLARLVSTRIGTRVDAVSWGGNRFYGFCSLSLSLSSLILLTHQQKDELSTKFNAHRNRNKFPIGTALMLCILVFLYCSYWWLGAGVLKSVIDKSMLLPTSGSASSALNQFVKGIFVFLVPELKMCIYTFG